MLTTSGEPSDAGSDQPDGASVYDFLYHDARRVGSFLAQFEPHGHLQALTRTLGVTDATATKSGAGGGGGIPSVLSLNASTEGQASHTATEGSSDTYDPLWLNALALLDHLEQRALLNRDLTSAGMGEFVLVRGALTLLDLNVIKAAWEAPSIQKQMFGGLPAQHPGQSRATYEKAKREAEQNIRVALDFLRLTPHGVQVTIRGGAMPAPMWMTLGEAGMVVSASDIMLKHGITVAGVWAALGVLDALPDKGPEDVGSDVGAQDVADAAVALSMSPIGAIAAFLAPMQRAMVGRPAHCYGMTPLLIFREVSASAE